MSEQYLYPVTPPSSVEVVGEESLYNVNRIFLRWQKLSCACLRNGRSG